tara:strand:- start:29 stop:244 length:216 start_codon:yes stop_codon:yes gene_type:complete
MTYILLIILTLSSPNQDSKGIELSIPYYSKEECLKASKKIDFSFKFPGNEIKTVAKCIPKESQPDDDNIET